jgi:hypothetical protein
VVADARQVEEPGVVDGKLNAVRIEGVADTLPAGGVVLVDVG